MTRLTSERLVLRAAEDQDLPDLFAIFSDAKAMRYWSDLPHKSENETKERLRGLWQPGPRNYFAVALGARVVGTCGVHTGDEIGFIFHPDVWGQGIAKEAAETVIGHIWSTTDLPRVTADADPRNLGSVGLLTRLRFEVTGYARNTFCVGGEWSDSVYLALPRPGSA